jgi:hypothetical protein
VKAISISISGLLGVVAMIIAAFFLNKKWNLRPQAGNEMAPTREHGMPSSADTETVEAILITTSYDVVYAPSPRTPASSMDHTIKVAAAIAEPGGSTSPFAAFSIHVRIPAYNDQVHQ